MILLLMLSSCLHDENENRVETIVSLSNSSIKNQVQRRIIQIKSLHKENFFFSMMMDFFFLWAYEQFHGATKRIFDIFFYRGQEVRS